MTEKMTKKRKISITIISIIVFFIVSGAILAGLYGAGKLEFVFDSDGGGGDNGGGTVNTDGDIVDTSAPAISCALDGFTASSQVSMPTLLILDALTFEITIEDNLLVPISANIDSTTNTHLEVIITRKSDLSSNSEEIFNIVKHASTISQNADTSNGDFLSRYIMRESITGLLYGYLYRIEINAKDTKGNQAQVYKYFRYVKVPRVTASSYNWDDNNKRLTLSLTVDTEEPIKSIYVYIRKDSHQGALYKYLEFERYTTKGYKLTIDMKNLPTGTYHSEVRLTWTISNPDGNPSQYDYRDSVYKELFPSVYVNTPPPTTSITNPTEPTTPTLPEETPITNPITTYPTNPTDYDTTDRVSLSWIIPIIAFVICLSLTLAIKKKRSW